MDDPAHPRRMVRSGTAAAAGRIVSALLLASVLTVLVALADRLVAHWGGGHLMLAVLVLWCTLFVGLLAFADGVRNFALGVVADLAALKVVDANGPQRRDVSADGSVGSDESKHRQQDFFQRTAPPFILPR